MMMRIILAMAVLTAGAVAATDAPAPYLQPLDMPDLTRILPPPPTPDSPQAMDDRAVFIQTRHLRGTPRWELATRDVTGDQFDTFACALGARLSARSVPALARLFARMGDAGMIGRTKAQLAVRRPYLGTNQPICEAKTDHLAANGDYPSGHTSNGWSTALILAELMPDRATEILRRGRIYGESRYVCGSHSLSAVEAGYMAGTVLVARLHASAAFRSDMDAARGELRRTLASRPRMICD